MDNAFEYKEEYGWLTNICLNVTDACNLACRYCFVEQHPHYMTYEIAEKAVYFILDNLEKKNKKFNQNEKAAITYFGGEPTLMWDTIIVPLTEWIRQNDFPISLSITTNGTLLNKERIDFLKKYNVPILLSIDGAEDTQNFNRPCINKECSFDKVVNNIGYILEAFPYTTFRGTIYAPTAKNTFENYMFAVLCGFKNIFLIPDSRRPWSEEQKEELREELNKIYSFMEHCFTHNEIPIDFSLIDNSFEHILKHDLNSITNNDKKTPVNRAIVRCGLGTGMGAIGYDGNIYGCQEQVSGKENNVFCIGNVNTGINIETHSKLLGDYYQLMEQFSSDNSKCIECPLRTFCHQLTFPSLTYELYHNFNTESDIRCDWYNWLFHNSAQMMQRLVEQDNQVFKFYLNKYCNYTDYFGKEEENNGKS